MAEDIKRRGESVFKNIGCMYLNLKKYNRTVREPAGPESPMSI